MTEKLTKGERAMLELAVQSETGNPWPLIGASQRAGGAKQRAFARMQGNGWFGRDNRITDAGREALKDAPK